MILLIDNYDSFVYNLDRYLRVLGAETVVIRNDDPALKKINTLTTRAIVLSPGPCTPREAGACESLIQDHHRAIPILGICLGHQCIASALGGKIVRSSLPVHGRTSEVFHNGTGLFADVPSPFKATRYHSLVLDESTLPEELQVVASTADGIPMAVQHQSHPLFGLQFHPESILTECGFLLLANFLRHAGIEVTSIPKPELSDVETAAQPDEWSSPAERTLHW